MRARAAGKRNRFRSARASDRGNCGLRPHRSVRRVLLALLLELLPDAGALELGEVIDEQLALEMIHLVLDAHGEQPLGVELERLAGAIERTHADALGTGHLLVDSGDRQTALFHLLVAEARDDLRID